MVVSADALLEASTTMIVGLIILVSLRQAIKLKITWGFLLLLAIPLLCFGIASNYAVGGDTTMSGTMFSLGLFFLTFVYGGIIADASKRAADRNKSTGMQESPRGGYDDKKPIFPEVAYDLVLLVGGGLTGSVVAIYYSRMIPEPSPDFLWLRLLLSLVFVVAIFFPLLYVMKRSLLRRAIR